MPEPVRGKAGMASSLVSGHQVGPGPPARRCRAEIPGLIEINPHGQLPESGDAASNFPGNYPGNLEAHETPRAIFRGMHFPGNPASRKFTGKFGRGSRTSLFSAILRQCAKLGEIVFFVNRTYCTHTLPGKNSRNVLTPFWCPPKIPIK